MNTYEGMFLFDTTFATDFSKVEQEVARLMERAGAETVMCKKWDERKLAYEIKGHKRGCYALVFFKADAGKIVGIERDVQLSEPVLRVLILRADHMTPEDMQAAYPSRPTFAKPPEPTGGRPPEGEPRTEPGSTKSGVRADVPKEETPDAQASTAVATAEVATDDSATTKAKDEAPSVATATEPAPEPAPAPEASPEASPEAPGTEPQADL